MKQTKPVLSIIIPSKNEESLIDACLASIMNQDSKLPYEVILVDGNSTDKTREIARKYPVRIVTDAKPGKCYGLQTGVQHAKGRILVFTEADCVVPPNWLRRIYNAFETNPTLAAITGIYTFHHSTPFYTLLVKMFLPAGMYIARFLIGTYPLRNTNYAIKKNSMDAVGGYDTRTTELYDLDLSLRLKHSHPIVFDPALSVQTSDRRIRGRLFAFLKEFMISVWHVWILRKPVLKPVYAHIR